jgi:hypothetical protein
MDNPEAQDELNRPLRKPGEPKLVPVHGDSPGDSVGGRKRKRKGAS